MIYRHKYNALNNAYDEMELDNNEAINECIDDDVLSKRSDDMTSEEFNNEISSEESISDTSIEELDYENLSETSDNSEIIGDESNDCMTNEKEPDKIVDESLSREQMPSINGEFAPYFNNITETLMFCWVENHNISTHAYDELVDIIRHPQFKSTDVTTNIRQFRKYRQRLPLLPIKSRYIHISNKKTPSTSQKTKEIYYLSITDIIWYTLNNPLLLSQMYFGPGQQVEKNQELWHAIYNCGDFVFYRESSTRVGRILAIVKVDDILKIKIQRILVFDELPNNLQNNNRKERSCGHEVWLLDRNEENAIIIVELNKIIKHIKVTILYNENDINEFSSIVIPLKDPLTSIPVYKLYIDLYYDDFGTFCNTYHSLGGVYIQIGNLSFDKRKQFRNHFVLGFVPFGSKFDEFIEPFVAEMKQLEKEKIMDIKGIESLVIASFGDVTAYLPQGNDLVGVKRHGATRGCRTCNATKDSWTSNNINLALISRYHHLTNIQFDEILAASTITRRKEIAAEYGLHIKLPILDKLKRERHLQSPHDIYHATASKVLRFLKITIDALSSEGKSAFIIFWKLFDYPKDWQKLPNPISHIDSFMMSDCLQLAMIVPFIFNRFLKPQHFKKTELTLFQQQVGLSRNDLAVKHWLKYWILVAKTMSIAFKHSFLKDDYINLHECLDNERKVLSQAFKDFENLPNLHVNFHLVQYAKNYATLLNTDLDLLKHYTTLFAICYLFDRGVDSRFSSSNNALMNFSHHSKRLVNNWFITEKLFDTSENLYEVQSTVNYISKINLRKRISRQKAKVFLPNNHDFFAELALAYQDMDYELTMFEDSCQFYEYICFLVEDNDTTIQYRLHVGEVVTIITENNSQNFAILKSIFSHRKNNQRFAFIIVDQFEITNQTKLECSIYKLRIENKGRQIFPIIKIDTSSTEHFIHNCRNDECIEGNHNFRNNLYIKNLYFFEAV
ncbi:hypothetical protein F8M41_017575 [Gigaspora margarita]|uniref:BAH domain-containing protein n=1 Tax=Gigaspora margarita TaxID=4874 RepID=A0A8H4EM32_GIGMA|nr:hypothetical protein F8M41_017575 [Gigaspora margarita]